MSRQTAVTVCFACFWFRLSPATHRDESRCRRILAAFQLFTCQRWPPQTNLKRVANGSETLTAVKGVHHARTRNFVVTPQPPEGALPAHPSPWPMQMAGRTHYRQRPDIPDATRPPEISRGRAKGVGPWNGCPHDVPGGLLPHRHDRRVHPRDADAVKRTRTVDKGGAGGADIVHQHHVAGHASPRGAPCGETLPHA